MGYNHILILHTDNGSFYKTKYLIDIVLALRECGYKVYLMTTTCSIKYINDVPIKLILPWFPKTLFGYYRKEMSIIRSIILAIYASWYPPKKEPTYVICDGSLLTIPILKHYGFHVCYLNYMVSFTNLMTKITDVKYSPFQISLLRKADHIIVPSRQCKLYLNDLSIENETVLMPCCDRNLYAFTPCTTLSTIGLKSVPYIFTVFGEYKKQSNFHLVLEAFKDLRCMLDEEKYFSKTRLIFIGHCVTEEEKVELELLQFLINSCEKGIAGKIIICDINDFRKVKTYLRHSLAFLDITENTLFNIMIIRAQSMGTPTISFNTGFQREIVKPESTGVFIAKRPFAIRNCMHRFIVSNEWGRQIGRAARTDMRLRFCASMFKENLNNLIMKSNVSKSLTSISLNDFPPPGCDWPSPPTASISSLCSDTPPTMIIRR